MLWGRYCKRAYCGYADAETEIIAASVHILIVVVTVP